MRNYLDHKDEVRYIDGLLANSQEWNWFIELVESNYVSDIQLSIVSK